MRSVIFIILILFFKTINSYSLTNNQIETAIKAYAMQSDRLQVVEYGKTHEGRTLYALYISSPENLANLDNIQTSISGNSSIAENVVDLILDPFNIIFTTH